MKLKKNYEVLCEGGIVFNKKDNSEWFLRSNKIDHEQKIFIVSSNKSYSLFPLPEQFPALIRKLWDFLRSSDVVMARQITLSDLEIDFYQIDKLSVNEF